MQGVIQLCGTADQPTVTQSDLKQLQMRPAEGRGVPCSTNRDLHCLLILIVTCRLVSLSLRRLVWPRSFPHMQLMTTLIRRCGMTPQTVSHTATTTLHQTMCLWRTLLHSLQHTQSMRCVSRVAAVLPCWYLRYGSCLRVECWF